MYNQRLTGLLVAGAVLTLPATARAHIEITSHTTRHGPNSQKRGPCGVEASPRGDTVYSYRHGETVTLEWYEFVDHPGHYRVAFDDEGDDDFVDPATAEDRETNETVLLDGIPDEENVHNYSVDLELPDLTCENCTIQIVQVMTDKPPYGDGNDLYYHCIDVRLVADGEPLPQPDEGCGCRTEPEAPTGYGVLALLLFIGLRRRPRPLPPQASTDPRHRTKAY